ncbi:hypothetical protein P9281_08690 [Caballeronia sp. LP003]|uniref:hypothetical protein n=1 Tax=Caballeronia sp. LP003 TaxID=3038551 RepID=UPI002861016C|nr:hypothetical protein [Caballeronia sp. LP003]MDR5786620.1 hypothetical protein [Caballeronia sp. LP003]
MKKFSWQNVVGAVPALFFVLTTIVGAYRWFSPVPFWDMWDGYITFNLNAETTGISAFLQQANEHRIILSKILFWMDWTMFGGSNAFLIVVNLFLMAMLWSALVYSAYELMRGNPRLAYHYSVLAGILCFSWLQAENITWGYQSQFFLAYLVPLLALILMAAWLKKPDREWCFALAVMLGLASTITMANGLLAPFLLIAMLALSGRSTLRRMLALILITAATLLLWQYDYLPKPHPVASVKQIGHFVLMFLGAPSMWIFHSEPLALIIGVAVVASGLYLAGAWVSGKSREPLFLALILFLAYIGAASVGAAMGRGFAGAGAALAGRYETPALLAFATIVLSFTHLYGGRQATLGSVRTLCVTVSVMLFSWQLSTLDAASETQRWNRMQAALALTVGATDKEMISTVYPEDEQWRVDRVRSVAGRAIAASKSVFGREPLKSIRNALGRPPEVLGLHACQGALDVVAALDGDGGHFRVQGWAIDTETKRVPRVVYFVKDDVVTGAALTGTLRPDVEKAIGANAVSSGFQGYNEKAERSGVSLACAP